MTVYRVFIQYTEADGRRVGAGDGPYTSRKLAHGVARWYMIELTRLGCSDIKIQVERQVEV